MSGRRVTRVCRDCGASFLAESKRFFYCPDCGHNRRLDNWRKRDAVRTDTAVEPVSRHRIERTAQEARTAPSGPFELPNTTVEDDDFSEATFRVGRSKVVETDKNGTVVFDSNGEPIFKRRGPLGLKPSESKLLRAIRRGA